MENRPYVGVVDGGRLRVLIAEGGVTGTLDVTSDAIGSEDGPFEREQVDLVEHEGLVVLLRGVDDGKTIHEAVLLEVGTQLMTVLARHIFESGTNLGVGAPEG